MRHNLPPILAQDYRRQRVWPLVRAIAATTALAVVGLAVLGFAMAPADTLVRDGGVTVTLDSIQSEAHPGVLKYSVHLDDGEIARIREACR